MNKNSAIRIGVLTTVIALGSSVQAQEAPGRSVWDGVYTEEQAARGFALYEKQCAECHGDKLGGRDSAPPLTGGRFISNWNGVPLSDLFERVRLTMPQKAPGKLGRQPYADILAYVLSFNRFPAGKTTLYRQAEMLKDIRFEATKPETKK